MTFLEELEALENMTLEELEKIEIPEKEKTWKEIFAQIDEEDIYNFS